MKLRLILVLGRFGMREVTEADVDRLVAAGALREANLVFAAWATCDCGAGLAHVVGARFWTCSLVLVDGADPLAHEAILPFANYAIPPEGDPQCPGETTRPRRAA